MKAKYDREGLQVGKGGLPPLLERLLYPEITFYQDYSGG
jgi:hypothetical protein